MPTPPLSSSSAARRRAAVLLPLALAGCVTWHPVGVGPATEATFAHARRVRVLRSDGASFTLTGVTVSGDSIVGDLVPDGGVTPRRVALPLAQVRRVETRGVDPARTTGAVLGGTALVVLAALGLLVALYLTNGAFAD